MTAEGDVALVHDKHCEVMVDTGAYFCRCWYRARIATLTEALRPFVNAWSEAGVDDSMPEDWPIALRFTFGDFRAARRALGQGER